MQIPGGANGKILTVDLKDKSVETASLAPEVYRRYLGGRAMGAYLALEYLDPQVDALGPDNVLVVSPGLLTGTFAPAAPRYSLVAKSPLTGTIGQTEAGGYWGPEFKRTGYDALVIRGRASGPVYLYISPEGVEIRSADHLWGRSTEQVQSTIRQDCDSNSVRVLQIGPAGENRVRYACVINELRHANGRNGLGAVMGSKNLRAIAVEAGASQLPVSDEDGVREAARWTAVAARKHPLSRTLHELGTAAGVGNLHAGGMLPTRNFREGRFAGYGCIDGETMEDKISTGAGGCYACPIRCKRRVRTADVDETYGGPEYETLAAFGSMVENDDLQIVAKCHALCNALGMDTISAGSTIAWAMECFEAGILTPEGEDEPLCFGDSHRLPQLLRDIAARRGLGELLAEGSARAAESIGGGSERFLTTVKGQEAPLQEPRAMGNMALGFSVSPTGADHITAAGDGLFSVEEAPGMDAAQSLGILAPLDPGDLSEQKVRLYLYLHFLWSLYDSLGLCYFGYAPRSVIPLRRMVDIVRAVTGWETTLWELLKAGQRAVNLTRVANVREGFNVADDVLPERFFRPLEGEGPLTGVGLERESFERARTHYYAMMGWNASGIPTESALAELDLTWCGQHLLSPEAPTDRGEEGVDSCAAGASSPDAPE